MKSPNQNGMCCYKPYRKLVLILFYIRNEGDIAKYEPLR